MAKQNKEDIKKVVNEVLDERNKKIADKKAKTLGDPVCEVY